MRIAVFHGPRDVRIEHTVQPRAGEGEAVVEIVASGICGSDLHRYRGHDPWNGAVGFPRSGGHEIAGMVSALGPRARGLEIGQRVAIEPVQLAGCGVCVSCQAGATNICANRAAVPGRGSSVGFAEFDRAPLAHLHPFPETLRFEEAALTDVYACAVHALHRVPVAAGMTVVVIGTGSVGLALGQTIRRLGAKTILAGRHRAILQAAASMGAADETILGETGPAPESLRRLTGGGGADIVFEAAGGASSESLRMAVGLARPGGTIGILGAFVGDLHLPYGIVNRKELTIRLCNGYGMHDGRREFRTALELIRDGTLNPLPLVTHRFPLAMIADAFRVADSKAKSGAIKVMLNSARCE
jgi:threonine dehydrogenase-like Zn-dependent dehydrogenase